MIEFLTSLEEMENSRLVEVAPPLTIMTEYLLAFAFIVFFFDKTPSCIKLHHYIILRKSQAQKEIKIVIH
jgi:hypothetical protein